MNNTRNMGWFAGSLLRRLRRDERGQVLPWTAFMLVSMLGMGALALDFGRAYVCYHQLQSATDAAALAGAEQLPAASYSTVAQQYSAGSGNYNAYNWMPNVNVQITGKCLTSLTNAGMACIAPANYNALQVVESYNVPTYFARLFGINSIPVASKAVASMRGSTSIPYNIAVIVDTTQSMNSTDSDPSCNTTRISCALSGVQVLLQNLAPCSSQLTSCGSVTSNSNDGSGNVTNPVDTVALFQFPNMTEATIGNDYDCNSSSATHASNYQFPTSTDTTYTRASNPPGGLLNPSSNGAYSSTYEVIGFSSDYKTLDATSTLNPNSNLVRAVGGKSGCTAMAAPGGLGTYYAGVIYAAQAALTAESTLRTAAGVNSQNVIILISDGQAEATQSQMGSTTGGATSGGTYPSWVNECAQAVTAAQYAANQGTHVYAVAYGSATSGCTTASGGTDTTSITPCQTMQGIASNPAYFYSDYTATGGNSSCVSTVHTGSTSLASAFTEIANDFTAARLIPNGTT